MIFERETKDLEIVIKFSAQCFHFEKKKENKKTNIQRFNLIPRRKMSHAFLPLFFHGSFNRIPSV